MICTVGMNKKDLMDKRADSFCDYVKRMEREATDKGMTFKAFLEEKFLKKPLGEIGTILQKTGTVKLWILKAKQRRSLEKEKKKLQKRIWRIDQKLLELKK